MAIVIIILIVFALLVLAIVITRSGIFGTDKGIKDGMRYESQGRFHEALASYDKVMQKANITPELRWRVANICIKLNLISRAQKELNVLISTKHYPANVTLPQIKAARAVASMQAGNERDAFYELTEVLNMNNKVPTVYRDLGTIYCHQAQTLKGISCLEKYLLNVPNDQDACYTLGIAYLDAGNAGKALSALERALRIKTPDTGEIYYYLGLIYLGNKKIPQALQNLGHAITKKMPPDMLSDAHRLMAICYREKGLNDEAMISYTKSI
ncbi:MAG: tetratricopeptide repeat protein, partial [Spirochaetales bacterium]|nr:tetratricopeptide repeat protein [Spirochaetales bacterium]